MPDHQPEPAAAVTAAPEPARQDRFNEYTVCEEPTTGTKLVHVTDAPTDTWDTYIGRAHPRGFSQSEWANPHRLRDDDVTDRADAVAKYRDHLADHLRENPDAISRLRDLAGQTLACWCVGENGAYTRCHGHVLLDAIAVLEAQARFDALAQFASDAPDSEGDA